MNKKLLNLLYRSFDEELFNNNKQQLESALTQYQELREEKKKIELIRKNISDTAVKSFHPFFADKVMRRIKQNGTKGKEIFFESLLHTFRPVLITATIIIIMLVSFNLFKSEKISLRAALGEPEINFEDVVDPAFTITMEISQ